MAITTWSSRVRTSPTTARICSRIRGSRRRARSSIPSPSSWRPFAIERGHRNIRVSWRDGKAFVTLPGEDHSDFLKSGFANSRKVELPGAFHPAGRKLRARQWSHVDFDGDGDLDLVIGIGDWTDYGWDDAFDEKGRWTNGPLHGFVYVSINAGTDAEPKYESARKLDAGGKPVDVFGWPSPSFADYDGDGDLDLICGEFVDRFTYFENTGSRTEPRYAAGRFLLDGSGETLRMPLCMIVPVAIDWDRDGDPDLVVGQEDGRVAWLENTGESRGGLPHFKEARFFRQRAHEVKFGALSTPFGFDWDADGDDDLICGNTAGEIAFIENLDGGDPPRLAAPVLLRAGGDEIRIQAGPLGFDPGPGGGEVGLHGPQRGGLGMATGSRISW